MDVIYSPPPICSVDGCSNFSNTEYEDGKCNHCHCGWLPFGPNYSSKPYFPEPWEQRGARIDTVSLGKIVDQDMAAKCGVSDNDDLSEYFDCEEVLHRKAALLSDMIRDGHHLVVYTGAGISQPAGIGTYRGPDGSWTLKARGIAPKRSNMAMARPTFAHMALVELHRRGILKCIVSTNTDGLHMRSGIPLEALSELHGNMYVERCFECKHEYIRSTPIRRDKGANPPETDDRYVLRHFTGRKCTQEGCGGFLGSTVVAFSESLPDSHLEVAKRHSYGADVALVLGSSMRVTPACNLPEYCWQDRTKEPGKFVLCNLQKTSYDPHAYMKVYASTDVLMRMVMENLGIEVPEYDESTDPVRSQ